MRVLITSGGTQVPVDDVRHIGNMSSGAFGCKIAIEALIGWHSVIYFGAEVIIMRFNYVKEDFVETDAILTWENSD